MFRIALAWVAIATSSLLSTPLILAEQFERVVQAPVEELPRRSTRYSTGFLVGRNGFSFANWAGVGANDVLTFANMARLFGKAGTCVEGKLDSSCTLRNGYRVDLSRVNAYLTAGRCEGMVVLAARLHTNPFEIRRLGPTATSTFELTRDETAQEIAYWWATQLSPAVQTFAARTRQFEPNRIARDVAFQIRVRNMVSIGLYYKGIGHSVLPISVVSTPLSTTFEVYDPNFPGQTRTLEINNLKSEWRYSNAVLADGSIGVMSGKGRGTLDYVPVNVRSKRAA